MYQVHFKNSIIAVDAEVVHKIPHLRKLIALNSANIHLDENLPEVLNPLDAQFCFEAGSVHLGLIFKLLFGYNVMPMVEIASQLDVLKLVTLAKYLEVDMDALMEGFGSWTKYNNWYQMRNPEYLYLLYLICPELVDFATFFSNNDRAIESIKDASELEIDPTTKIEMLNFYSTFNFGNCHLGNNPRTRKQVESLDKQRAAINSNFLIKPFEHADYFKYTPSSLDVWSCENIKVAPRPTLGADTITTLDEFRARFAKFTCGALDKPIGQVQVEFPFANVVFAGGSITKLLCNEYDPRHARSSDLDMFIIGENFEAKTQAVADVLAWFDAKFGSNNTYFVPHGSIIYIYIKDLPRTFQIISNDQNTVYDIIGRFDMTHIQWCLYKGDVYGTPAACRSMRYKTVEFTNIGRLKQERIIKALYCGYDVYKDSHVISNLFDVTGIVTDYRGATMQNYLKGFKLFYYPQSQPGLEEDEEREYIRLQVEEHSYGSAAADSWRDAGRKIIIGGNFEADYNSISYDKFNAATVIVQALARNTKECIVMHKTGHLYLTSDRMVVVDVKPTEENHITITLAPTADFIAFTRALETDVYVKYQDTRVENHIVNGKNELNVTILKHILDNQATRGKTFMKSARGEPKNIEEDLKAGDMVRLMFRLKVHLRENRRVEIVPSGFTSYTTDDDNAAEIDFTDIDTIAGAVNAVSTNVDYDSNPYEEYS